MFVQHMLAVLAPAGMMATVMPHGVLFRGGAEQSIRRGFVEDDVLEAVIGLPSNLFYGTSIPTCILVMRRPDSKAPEHRGKVLFINAEVSYEISRGQNRLSPEHRERIVRAFKAWGSIPGFVAVVDTTELAANDFNLNIRRYVDSSPPPEPHDVRAHLLGGFPKSEVEELAPRLCMHGLDTCTFFCERLTDDGYLDFQASLVDPAQIKALIVEHAGVRSKETLLLHACQQWWWSSGEQLLALLPLQHLLGTRDTLLRSFETTLSSVGPLDDDSLCGIFATWWEKVHYDLKTLVARGFEGLLDTWIESCAAPILEGAGAAVDQKLLGYLLPSCLEKLAEINFAIVDLEGQLAEIKQSEEEENAEEPKAAAQAQKLRKALVSQKKARAALLSEVGTQLEAARAALSEVACRQVVLNLWLSDLLTLTEQRMAKQRGEITTSIEHLWDKYRVSLREIEASCRSAELQMEAIFKKLGYADA